MRRPQKPDEKNSPDDHTPPGGRAWQRVRDFERARGLPAESTPHPDDERDDADKAPPKKKRDS
jgi:hypothetical protein